ncbi:MAG: insulinase family protein [Bacillota bacterium]|nr:insulinase family protein [Bacillota bacterium]
MELGKEEILHGFRVDRTVPVKEIGAQLVEMTHEQTKLKLVWLNREEENKTFAITFETLPWNDTGVFHILEHSVLCGSDRYPVKEPFIELLKNSMNTFLNAMTFPDKTMYPVSSQNNQDFINLMRVYLDAVFHPAIYSKPEIFMQEGWHYEKDEKGTISYKGVVFNEMKGAMADAGEIMEAALNRAMLPDTPYAYNSGGDPEAIPDLTYEQFIDAHRKFYSPSNGIIFLDGSIDLDQVLGIINDEFLANLPEGKRVAQPAVQAPVDGGLQTIQYEIGPEEPANQRMRMAWGRGLCMYDQREKLLAMDILCEVLAGSNEAYLNKLILQNNLAEDVVLRVYEGIAQPWLKMEVRNYNKKDSDEIEQIIFGELRRLAAEGIDRDRLEAVMANSEFLMEEHDFGTYPQGLFFGFMVMDSMLYGGAPEMYLEKGSLYDDLRNKIDEGYFEELIREILLENDHKCKIILEPSVTLGEERRKREALRIEEASGKWSQDDEERIQDMQDRLEAWQNSEDKPEDLEKLPHLTLADMDEKPEDIPAEIKDFDGVRVIRHPIETGDIRYVSIYFEVDKYDKTRLSQLSFLAELLGSLHTKKYSSQELIVCQQKLLGRLDFDLLVFGANNSKTVSSVQFTVTFSVLESKVTEAVKLITDILSNTQFDQDSRILDILKQCRQERRQSFIMGGNSAANRRVLAMAADAGAAQEAITGFEYYQWLEDKLDNQNSDGMEGIMLSCLRSVINKEKMTVSVTAGKDYDETGLVQALADGVKSGAWEFDDYEIKDDVKAHGFRKEGMVIPADISFAVRGGDLITNSGRFSGKMQVAARIISLAYLWNVIRVQGGAYGAGMSVHPSGMITCYSYRDPSGASSLQIYLEAAAFLREMASDDFDLTGFIIGAVSDASPLMTPRLKAQVGDSFYFRGVTYEQRCQVRRELLSVTREELTVLADSIEDALNLGGFCIVGSEEQLESAGDLDLVMKV